MSSNPITMYEAIDNAHAEMYRKFNQSWMYWPLRWFSSLGNYFATPHYDVQFIQCYNNSHWFFQWWFKSYLDETSLKQFEDVVDTYHQYVKEDLSNLNDFFNLPIHFILEIFAKNISKKTFQECRVKDLQMLKLLKLSPNHFEELINHRDDYSLYEEINLELDSFNIDFSCASLLKKNTDELYNMLRIIKELGDSITQFKDEIDCLFELKSYHLYSLKQLESFSSCTTEDLKMYSSLGLSPVEFSELLKHRDDYEQLKTLYNFFLNADREFPDNYNLYEIRKSLLNMTKDDILKTADVIEKLTKAQCLGESIYIFDYKLIFSNQLEKLLYIVKTLADSQSLSLTTFQEIIDETLSLDSIQRLRKSLSLEQVDGIFKDLGMIDKITLDHLLTKNSIQSNLKYLSDVEDKNSFVKIILVLFTSQSGLKIDWLSDSHFQKISTHQNLKTCYELFSRLFKGEFANLGTFEYLINLKSENAEYVLEILKNLHFYGFKEDILPMLLQVNEEALKNLSTRVENLSIQPLFWQDTKRYSTIKNLLKEFVTDPMPQSGEKVESVSLFSAKNTGHQDFSTDSLQYGVS